MVTDHYSMRIQVPPAAVLEAHQILDGMPNILRLVHVNELKGWLNMELVPASHNNSVNAYRVNRILSALIRAKIPIISFAPESEPLQDRFLTLTSDATK